MFEGKVFPYASSGGEFVETQKFVSLQIRIRQYAATLSPGRAFYRVGMLRFI